MKHLFSWARELFSSGGSAPPRPAEPSASQASKPIDGAKSAPRSASATTDEIERELCAHIAKRLRPQVAPEKIDAKAHLFDSGYIDSFSYVELVLQIEQRYGVAVRDFELSGQLNTVEKLAAFIAARSSGASETTDR